MGRSAIVYVIVALAGCRVSFDKEPDAPPIEIDAGVDAAQADPIDARLVFGFLPVTTSSTRTRIYDHAAGAWSAAASATPAIASFAPRWVIPRAFAGTARELVAVLSSSGAATRLDIHEGPDGGWPSMITIPGVPVANDLRRGFDLEYEAGSGAAMIVYSDGSDVPKYRVLAGAVWSAEAPVTASPPGGAVMWIELVARPGSNEIALVYADDANDLRAVIWDGVGWSGATLLESSLRVMSWKCFDAAFENTSGDLLIVWGRDTAMIPGFVSSVKLAGQGSFSAPSQDVFFVGPGVVELAAEPGTDRIAMIELEYTCDGMTCDNAQAGIWDGFGWAAKTNLDENIGASYASRLGSKPLAVGWAAPGQAIALWSRTTTALTWAQWTQPTSWILQPEFVTSPAVGEKASIEFVGRADGAVAMFTDANGALWAKRYDGSAWSDTEAGAALETTVGTAAQPFGVSRR